MAELRPGARRLAAEQGRDRRPQGATHWQIEPATIATVTAGAASDGNALATVTYRGVTQDAPYLDSYTPTAGHVVALHTSSDGSLLILGQIIGTP